VVAVLVRLEVAVPVVPEELIMVRPEVLKQLETAVMVVVVVMVLVDKTTVERLMMVTVAQL
jgi:hypothetical protein